MMVLSIATQMADRVSLLYEAVALMVVGMLVVFTALCLTAGTIALLNRCLGGQVSQPSEAAASSSAPGGPAVQKDAHLRVVLAAAATMAVGRAVRVERFAPVKG